MKTGPSEKAIMAAYTALRAKLDEEPKAVRKTPEHILRRDRLMQRYGS